MNYLTVPSRNNLTCVDRSPKKVDFGELLEQKFLRRSRAVSLIAFVLVLRHRKCVQIHPPLMFSHPDTFRMQAASTGMPVDVLDAIIITAEGEWELCLTDGLLCLSVSVK